MLAHSVLDTTAQTAKKCHSSSGCFIRTSLATRKLTKTTSFQDERKKKHQGINFSPMNSGLLLSQ